MLGNQTRELFPSTLVLIEQLRQCKGCLSLVSICTVLFIILLYTFVSGEESSRSLAGCIKAADEACQLSFTPDVRVRSGELDPSGEGCYATCTNGGLVTIVWVSATATLAG